MSSALTCGAVCQGTAAVIGFVGIIAVIAALVIGLVCIVASPFVPEHDRDQDGAE